MKAICEGRTTRREVVQDSVEQYREVYARSQRQFHLLKAVRCGLFDTNVERKLLTAN